MIVEMFARIALMVDSDIAVVRMVNTLVLLDMLKKTEIETSIDWIKTNLRGNCWGGYCGYVEYCGWGL
jgi:hypothetical protein